MMLGMVAAEDLSDAERRVWDAFPTGQLVDFGTGNAEDDDPAGGEGWGPDRQVRAEVLAALLCGAVEVEPGHVGEVYLHRARITGALRLPGATFKYRLRLNECYVPDGIDLADATTRTLDLSGCRVGAIRIERTEIDGVFRLNRVRLEGTGGGPALTGQDLTVTGDMFCTRGFQVAGKVDLTSASIGGDLDLDGAHLDGKGGGALDGQDLNVTGNMFCTGGFQAAGEVNLTTASIGGDLDLDGAHLDGKGRGALRGRGLTVTGSLYCRGGFQAVGMVYLSGAKVGKLEDDKESWPQALHIDGLTYGDLAYLPARERLGWLNRSVGYWPQPYEQLAGYYRRLGHDEQARRVLLVKQRQRRRQRPWWARWWGWLQDALAGYGYAPGRALLLLAGAFVAGWLVFRAHQPVPVGPGPHPTFNAALYTLDVLIPAPALGQASDFDPQGVGLVVAAGLHILGWLLAITVIAAITRAFSRT